MPGPNPFLEFTRRLDRIGLSYMATGSVAMIFHGEPRLTLDVDIVLWLPSERIREFADAFPPSEFYCPPEEVIAIEVARERRGHFNLIHRDTGFKADIYLAGDNPLHAWGLSRANRLTVGEDSIVVAPPEYVILRKLEYYREGGSEKHLRDIQSILRISGEDIDRVELDRFAQERGLDELWAGVRGSD